MNLGVRHNILIRPPLNVLNSIHFHDPFYEHPPTYYFSPQTIIVFRPSSSLVAPCKETRLGVVGTTDSCGRSLSSTLVLEAACSLHL